MMLIDFVSYLGNRFWSSLSLQALKLRSLIDWGLPLIGLTLQDFYDLKEKIYIHPQCSSALHNLLIESNLNSYEKVLVQQLMTNDYHDSDFVQEFTSMLDRKFGDCDVTMKRKLNKIFAIDGFGTDTNYAKNINYLKYQMTEEANSPGQKPFDDIVLSHVIAVRHLYDKGATPIEVYRAILHVYENEDAKDDNELARSYRRSLGTLRKTIMEKVVKIKLENEAATVAAEEEEHVLDLGKEAA